MGGFKQKVISSKLFIRSRYEYLEIKAEMLISRLIHLLMSNPNVLVYSKNKGIGLTVPILLEGTVYMCVQCIAKVFIPLHFFHILLFCSLMLNCFNFFFHINLHSIHHYDKAQNRFVTSLQIY